jgi:4-hydroxy-3-polyprenylbenzoate decarboxylase
MSDSNRLIVAITGASGSIFGIRVLQLLRQTSVEAHLVISKWGARTMLHETSWALKDVQALAHTVYHSNDEGAAISSGSFRTRGMLVAPCSARSLAAVAHGLGDSLVHRAADVILKERRRLVLAVREAPLSEIHLENMLKLSRMGVVICPPVPAFYTQPASLDDLVTYTAVRLLDQFDIHIDVPRWDGEMGTADDQRRRAVGALGPRARRHGDAKAHLRCVGLSYRALRGPYRGAGSAVSPIEPDGEAEKARRFGA